MIGNRRRRRPGVESLACGVHADRPESGVNNSTWRNRARTAEPERRRVPIGRRRRRRRVSSSSDRETAGKWGGPNGADPPRRRARPRTSSPAVASDPTVTTAATSGGANSDAPAQARPVARAPRCEGVRSRTAPRRTPTLNRSSHSRPSPCRRASNDEGGEGRQQRQRHDRRRGEAIPEAEQSWPPQRPARPEQTGPGGEAPGRGMKLSFGPGQPTWRLLPTQNVAASSNAAADPSCCTPSF